MRRFSPPLLQSLNLVQVVFLVELAYFIRLMNIGLTLHEPIGYEMELRRMEVTTHPKMATAATIPSGAASVNKHSSLADTNLRQFMAAEVVSQGQDRFLEKA